MPYERFIAWKACHEMALAVFVATRSWPRSEIYGLTAQARRAAFSVPANFAEGSAKRGSREFRRYLDISIGSLSELSYTLRFVRELDLIGLGEYQRLEHLRADAARLTWLLYRSLGSRQTA